MAVNIRNAVIAFLVPLPSILFYLSFLGQFRDHPLIAPAGESNSLSPLWIWCYQHPLLLANALFFLNVNLSFWIIGLLQSSHWVGS